MTTKRERRLHIKIRPGDQVTLLPDGEVRPPVKDGEVCKVLRYHSDKGRRWLRLSHTSVRGGVYEFSWPLTCARLASKVVDDLPMTPFEKELAVRRRENRRLGSYYYQYTQQQIVLPQHANGVDYGTRRFVLMVAHTSKDSKTLLFMPGHKAWTSNFQPWSYHPATLWLQDAEGSYHEQGEGRLSTILTGRTMESWGLFTWTEDDFFARLKKLIHRHKTLVIVGP